LGDLEVDKKTKTNKQPSLFHITYGVANSAIILGLILVAKSFEGPSAFGLQTNLAASSLASGWSYLLVQWR
jgi:hypothetical protein